MFTPGYSAGRTTPRVARLSCPPAFCRVPGGTVAAAVWDYGEEMEMLRVFWDEAIKLAAAVDEEDERHMPLCGRGELRAT